MDRFNKLFTGRDLDEFERVAGPLLPDDGAVRASTVGGRLGQSVEGGGKRRIFAIGNYVNQRLLKPVHDWLMSVLRLIPMDGTFFFLIYFCRDPPFFYWHQQAGGPQT